VFESRVPEHVVGTVLEIVHVWAGSAHVIHDFTALDGRLFRRAHDKDCKLPQKRSSYNQRNANTQLGRARIPQSE
jgi:hypothetical protein